MSDWFKAKDKIPNLHEWVGPSGRKDPKYLISDEVLGWSKSEGYVFVIYVTYSFPFLLKEKTEWEYSDREYGRGGDPCEDIIAWAPLPEPYRGDKNED